MDPSHKNLNNENFHTKILFFIDKVNLENLELATECLTIFLMKILNFALFPQSPFQISVYFGVFLTSDPDLRKI